MLLKSSNYPAVDQTDYSMITCYNIGDYWQQTATLIRESEL